MADADINEQSGGTQGEEQTQEYTKESVERMIQEAAEKALKEGESKAHQHWQSVADKKISDVNRLAEERLSKYETELSAYKKQRFETLSPEEQQAAMLKEIYERMNSEGEKKASPEVKAPEVHDEKPADFGNDDPRQAARKQISPVLQELGIDIEKVDWADETVGPDSMKRFLASIVTQVRGAPAAPEKTEEEVESDRVNTSRSIGKSETDILKMNPRDLVMQGLKDFTPTRLKG